MRFIKLAVACAAALAVSSAFDSALAQDKKVRLNMAGAFPSSIAMLGPGQLYFADKVKKLSAGSIDIRFFEPGALVPASQYFDAVASGSLDSAWTGLGFFTGKDIAFALFSSVPFGPELGEYMGWMRFGGGEQLMQELARKYNVEVMLCGTIAPEASGWFRKEIKIGRRSQGPEDALLRARRQRHAEAGRRTPRSCRPAKSSRRCSSAPSTPPNSRCRSWT